MCYFIKQPILHPKYLSRAQVKAGSTARPIFTLFTKVDKRALNGHTTVSERRYTLFKKQAYPW